MLELVFVFVCWRLFSVCVVFGLMFGFVLLDRRWLLLLIGFDLSWLFYIDL